jgi:transcription termination factor Rho
MDPNVLARKQLPELKSLAAELQMRGYQRLRKADLIDAIVKEANRQADPNQRGDASNGAQLGEEVPVASATEPTAGNGGRFSDNGEQLRLEREDDTGTPQVERDAGPRARASASEPGGGDPRARASASEPGGGDPRVRASASEPAEADAHAVGGRDLADGGGDIAERREAGDEGDDGDDGTRRRRRSRRERRRNRGPVGPSDNRGQQSRGDEQNNQPNHQSNHQPSQQQGQSEPGEVRTGVLDVLPEGYGFLRTTGYLPGDRDAYVSQSTIRKMGLRRGDVVAGPIRQQKASDKVPALAYVQTVNNVDVSEVGRVPARPDFKDMTPLFPDERLHLETPGGPISMRIVDLMSPIGKGQRGLIVSPPKAGKTTILKELGQAIIANNPECHLMVVLVDERPEEVTDMQRSVKGEIVASTFDRPADDHTQIAELAMERAKRLVEQGQDVVVLLDSITRLARAYNLSAPASGRIMSGGVDSTALYPPKRFFGAARNIEGGGSLTIIATALIETGSKMDEVIFEEFKGTGNMELRLDRRMEQKRIFPAIDIEASGTRKEELLLDREELAIIWKLRRVLAALEGPAALELLIDKIKSTRSNNQFLQQIQKSNLQT